MSPAVQPPVPQKDPLVAPGCLIGLGTAIVVLVAIGVSEPNTGPVTGEWIGALVVLATVIAVLDRRRPYTRAARAFQQEEAERVQVAMGQRLDSLHLLTPREFEFAVARLFTAEGWQVEVTAATADGGKDLILRRNTQTILVEVKQFAPDRKVGRPLVMKLHSAVIHERATGGVFVATSAYTAPAREFAELNEINLIDGGELAARLLSAFPEAQGPTYLRAMCRTCASVVPFEELNLDSKPCPHGHAVANPIPLRFRPTERAHCPMCGAEFARVRTPGSRLYRYVCPVCRKGPIA